MRTPCRVDLPHAAAPLVRETRRSVRPTVRITARGRAHERLRDSAESYRLLVASVLDYAIFMLDPDGCVASWNAGAQRLKGYREDEIIGQHFSRFYPPEDIKQGKP